MSPRIDGSASRNYDYNRFNKEASTKPAESERQPSTGPEVTNRAESNGSVPVSSSSSSFSADSGLNASVSGTGPGGVQLDAYAEGPSFEASFSHDVSADTSGIHVDLSVDIDATLAEAGASAEKTFTFEAYGEEFEVTVDLAAMGKIGVDGSLNLSLDIGPNGVDVSASAEGFAGAQASITGGISLSHEGNTLMSGEATLSASAGVSGSANADVGFDGGTVSFEASASASAGVGFGAEVSGEIDTVATADAVAQVFAGALREGVEEVAETAAEFADNTAEFIGDRAEDLVNLAEDVGGFILDTGGAIIDGAADGLETVGGWLGLG